MPNGSFPGAGHMCLVGGGGGGGGGGYYLRVTIIWGSYFCYSGLHAII